MSQKNPEIDSDSEPSSKSPKPMEEASVPKGRFARFGRMTALATSVAGGMVAEGARQLAQGKRPKISNMLLTPSNAKRVANQLANLRGAAMKLGQLLSMDAGDFLPKELADILARLRSDAKSMPQAQLQRVLLDNWGEGWQTKLRYFSMTPMAAASIGQVHEAITHDGEKLAVKIQYPGVRESIDSDIDNVAGLLRLSGLLPKNLDIQPLLNEAKQQLREEADYLREAECLKAYAAALGDDPNYLIPKVFDEFTTANILAMSHVEGVPVESLDEAPEATRNRVATFMFGLMFKELFDFSLMQTDPNFANYRYNPRTQQLVLLDFGATRHFEKAFGDKYSFMVDQGLLKNREGLNQSALNISYYDANVQEKHRKVILDLMELACEPLRMGTYPFGQTDLAARVRDAGLELSKGMDFWHTPPVDSIFLHRKVAGVFLLASRLKATVDVKTLLDQARK
ncbi:MAG: AarF/ABC1/UbiB kinase family protein [Limnobacter sp.]|nr:AarF/ABC1/UbiB kinase family protein [Limnobacter sp.]